MRGVVNQLSDTEQARSPLWTERSLKRRMEVLRAPFGETKAAAKRLGGTLNTAFLTAAAEAAGRYHERMGSPVEELRASMAISTRSEGSGSNAFSLARMLVPTGEMPIAERFTWIQAAAGAAARVQLDGVARDLGRRCLDIAHLADHSTGASAGADGRLRHVERARRTGAAVRRRVPRSCRTTRSDRSPESPTT